MVACAGTLDAVSNRRARRRGMAIGGQRTSGAAFPCCRSKDSFQSRRSRRSERLFDQCCSPFQTESNTGRHCAQTNEWSPRRSALQLHPERVCSRSTGRLASASRAAPLAKLGTMRGEFAGNCRRNRVASILSSRTAGPWVRRSAFRGRGFSPRRGAPRRRAGGRAAG